MLDTFYLLSFFPSITFINYVSSNRKMYRSIMRMISTSTGTNEVRWWPIIFIVFSKLCLVENIQEKFQKNSSGTFISEESP